MYKKLFLTRSLTFFGAAWAVALMGMSAFAQTHIYTGNAGNNNSSFTGAFWEDAAGTATGTPGSLQGGLATDQVLIQKQRTGNDGNETVRINNVDIGMIDMLTIGGQGPNATQGDEARLQVRGNNGNIQINTLQLGTGGANSNPGQFQVNNNGSSATVGNVISGSLDTVNRIIIGNNGAGGFTLSGDIDGTGSMGAVADRVDGIREIDVFIEANDDVDTTRVDLSTGNQVLSVDAFRVGANFNSNATSTASFTLDAGNNVQANEIQIAENGGNTNGGNTNSGSTTATFTVTNATASAYGDNDENGNISIGRANAAKPEGGTSDGTINVGAGGTLEATNVLSLGTTTNSAANPAGSGTLQSTGTLNVTDATSLVSIGRVAGAANTNQTGTVRGGINVGLSREGEGIINLSAGTIESYGRVFIAGDSDNGNGSDAGTTGTVNITGTGLFEVGVDPTGGGNGLDASVDIDGNAVAAGTNVGNQNFEVGHDGNGFLNLADTGELNIYRGNLVIGQNGADTVDERGVALATPLDNRSRGTVTMTGDSIIRVGSTQGSTVNNGAGATGELFNDINFNGGGGDFTLSDNSFLMVERDINFNAVDPGRAISTLTINGDQTDINVGRDLDLNADSLVTFDFDNTSDYDFNFDVGRDVNFRGAMLDLTSISMGLDLNTFDGDILLIDIAGTTRNGVFSNAAEGAVFGEYRLTYVFSGTAGGDEGFGNGTGSSLALVRAVPEPGTLAFFGICALGLATRRRRS